MDTIPFHFVMFALDIILIFGFAWFPVRRSSMFAIFGLGLFGFVGIAGIIVAAVFFKSNFGQCAVEGITVHGSFFLLVAAVILWIKNRRWLSGMTTLIGLFIFVIGFDMLWWEPFALTVEHYTIKTKKIKEPLRIVFVTDIQTDRIREYERRTFRTIQEQNPDLIILGGDYLQYYEDSPGMDRLIEQFKQLLRESHISAPLGVFALQGNIDLSRDNLRANAMFKDAPLEFIYDSTLIENLGAEQNRTPIDLALLAWNDSIDGVGEKGLSDSGNFLIMAGHYPNYAIRSYQNSERAPDLMLAGHTHGGQIALPFYGAVRVKYTRSEAFISRRFLRGMIEFENGGHLLISRGTGMERAWAPRIRFLCPPEISVIDIIPE
ncbi:MAG: metallophosphoesterase [Thermoguttaceae bacterium]